MNQLFQIMVAAILVSLANHACAQSDRSVVGKIESFECGDNCYLTISDERGNPLTGLCAASHCRPWNAEARMPSSMVGKRIEIIVGVAGKLDGDGNEVGKGLSFSKIRFLDPAAPQPKKLEGPRRRAVTKCVLEVEGKTYINGPCDFRPRAGGGFEIHGPNKWFAIVDDDSNGIRGYWNNDDGHPASRAHDNLGALMRSGACFIGSRTRVCAWGSR